MSFCFICSLHKLYRPTGKQTSPRQLPPVSSDLATELEDSRRFSLNSLMALLAILTISRSKVLQPVALILLIYTINLRLAMNTCFLHNYPTFSRFLHVIPLLGTYCMAGVELISGMQSPAFAVLGLLLGALPLVAIVIHHGRQCVEAFTPGLPMRMQDLSVPAVPRSVDTTLPSD